MPLLILLLTLSGYEKFDSRPFHLLHRRDATFATRFVRQAHAAAAEIETRFGLRMPEVTIVVVETTSNFRRLTGREHAVGVADWARRTVMIDAERADPFSSPVRAVLRHELFHVALAGALSARGLRVPLWLNEGCAQISEGRVLASLQRQTLVNAARGGRLNLIEAFDERYPPPEWRPLYYAAALEFVRHLQRRAGDGSLRAFLAEFVESGDFEAAFEKVFGESPRAAHARWLSEISAGYSFWWQFLQRLDFFGVLGLLLIVLVVVHFVRRRRLRARLEREDPFWDAD